MSLNLAFIGNNADSDNSIKQIPLSSLHPYRNHKFALYSGERLVDMIQSIKQNGILNPIIVRPLGVEYEILSGHNRTNAAKLAGLQAVPAVIKTGLTDEEAEIYVIETNLIQRGFSDLAISEQAAVVAMRYSEMFNEEKVEKIRVELQGFSSEDKKAPAEAIGGEYGLGSRTVSRLIRINKLNESLKEWVDSGELSVRAGVELSFLPSETQECLYYACTDDNSHMRHKIDMKTAERIRAEFEDCDDVDESSFERFFEKPLPATKPKAVKIKPEVYSRFFKPGSSEKEIEEIIVRALEGYFGA
jgi:ParB family chromosome partitioning protein